MFCVFVYPADSLQFAHTVAFIWHSVPSTRWSQFMWNGMLDCHPIYDAVICHCINSLFPMAYEQRSWCDNVFALLCIRCYITNVRIRALDMSILKCSSDKIKRWIISTSFSYFRLSIEFDARESKWMWKAVIFNNNVQPK